MAILSSGRKKVKDLNDIKALQLFLGGSQPKTQIYNQDTGAYAPDWSVNNQVLTPELYVAGTNTNILSQAKAINWYDENNNPISASTVDYVLGTNNTNLTINRNILRNYLNFDGSSTAYVPVNNPLGETALNEEWTVIAEVYGLGTSTSAQYLINGVNAGLVLATSSTPGGGSQNTPLLYLNSGTNDYYMYANKTIVDGKHHTIAFAFRNSDGTRNIYIDDVLSNATGPNDTSTPSGLASTFQIGSYTKGGIGCVQIWNRLLSATEIAQYSKTKPVGNEANLVGHWSFDEGQGTVAHDKTASHNDGPIQTGVTWNTLNSSKNLICQVTYTDPSTHTDQIATATIDLQKAQVGQTGVQGPASIIGTLNNDTAVITTANDGTGGTYGAPNTQSILTILSGTTDVTSQYTIAQTRNNVTVTEATNSATATVTAMSADTGSVVFTATRSGYPTITKTFSLLKSKMGAAGNQPTDYWLNLSTNNITAADDGSYTPSTITLSSESQVGTNAVQAYASRFIIYESTDGSNFTSKYTSSADESSHTYTPSSGLAAIKVEMYQAGGTSIKLDTQTILVINNGKNSVMVSAWTPQGNVIRNAANTVTAEADLLNGGQPVTGTNYRWVKGNGAATSVIAGAGYEDLDLGKRNLLSGTSESFQTVSVTSWSGPLGNGSQFLNLTLSQLRSSVGDTVTASLYINPTNGHGGFLRADYYKTDGTYNILPGYNIITTTTGAGYSHLTFTIGADFDHLNLYLGNENAGTNLLYNVDVKELKIEKSSTRTCWGLAYEDQPVSATDNTLYGRNLLRDSGFNNGVASWGVGANWVIDATQYISGYNVRTCDRTSLAVSSSTYSDLTQTVTLPADYQLNVPYTVSFWIKATAGTGSSLPFRWYFTNITSYSADNAWTPITATTGWTKVYRTMVFTTKQNNSNPTMYFRCFDGNAVSITQPKWEQTAYMTDYSPAPEDNSTLYPNGTAGVNNWVYRNYTDGSNATRKIYGYSDFPSLTPVYQTLIADGASLRYGDYGSYFVGYYKTAVYVSTAKTINYQFAQDDTINILVNGLQQGSQINTETTAQTYPLSLQAGWNTIELILQEIQGNDGIELSNTLSTLVEEMNCNYALDFGSAKGNYGLMGYNTSSMIVNTNAVTDTDLFECLVTYRGAVYKDSVTINDVTDPITMIINGSKLFKNNQGTNTYTAQLYQNGAEIDAGGTQYTYTWYVYNSDGSLDATFGGSGSKTGKTITLASSDINVKGKLQCQVSM